MHRAPMKDQSPLELNSAPVTRWALLRPFRPSGQCRVDISSRASSQGRSDAERLALIVWILLLGPLLLPLSAPAQQQLPEEKVVVTANAYPVPFENLSRTVAVFTRQDIEKLPAKSIADVLAHATALDLRPRTPFGGQADISVRGAGFSQALILVDGVRINDSQTAHHNADFPVQLQEVERIEVMPGAGSSLYGADAFGGTINIVTRRDPESVRASFGAGQHGLVEGAGSASFRSGSVRQSINVSGSRSSGFEYDRDSRTVSINGRTGIGPGLSIFASHVNKEFGANGFYGPAPSREWTNQTMVSVEHNRTLRPGAKAEFQAHYRTHGDRFLYDQRTPGLFENRHRTHAAGATVKLQRILSSQVTLALGGEAGGDWIRSTNLGNHSYTRMSVFGEMQWRPSKTASLYPGLRIDYYSSFGAAVSPSVSGSWWIQPRVRVRSSGGRAFRIPSFTERYYRDPNHQADPQLKPERAWSAELGTDVIPAKEWMLSLTVFTRRESDVIDWVRSFRPEIGNDKWRTANIRKLHTSGLELGIERSLGAEAGFSVRYSRISSDPGSVDYVSKYVLDYARDLWSGSAFFPIPFSFRYRQSVNYKRRADGRSYWLLDNRLERDFSIFTASIECSNLLNERYQEVLGVNMPGRWFSMTLRTR